MSILSTLVSRVYRYDVSFMLFKVMESIPTFSKIFKDDHRAAIDNIGGLLSCQDSAVLEDINLFNRSNLEPLSCPHQPSSLLILVFFKCFLWMQARYSIFKKK